MRLRPMLLLLALASGGAASAVAAQAPQVGDSIPGLPAEVVADLARQALQATDPAAAERAFEALDQALGGSSHPGQAFAASGPRAGEAAAWELWVERRMVEPVRRVVRSSGWPPQAYLLAAIGLLLTFGLVSYGWSRGVLSTLRWPRRGRSSTARWGAQVTQAAQLLATGARPEEVSARTGLALDVLDVVASRRLRPPTTQPGPSSQGGR